jgi:hypothetical protein
MANGSNVACARLDAKAIRITPPGVNRPERFLSGLLEMAVSFR